MYLRDNTVRNHLCECEVLASSKRVMVESVLSMHAWNQEVFMATQTQG